MAIGAGQGDVVKLVFQPGSSWVAIGVVLETGGAVALTSALRTMVYEMESTDPLALLWATLAIAISAAIACWLPARRAARVAPIIALRAE